MAKEFMTSAKDLAWKAYQQFCSLSEPEMRIHFESWWSINYGNADTTKFVAEHNVYIEGKRYIKAE